jgi:protein-disulfide isomerase
MNPLDGPPNTAERSAGNRALQLVAALVFAAIVIVAAIVVVSGRSEQRASTPGDAVPGQTETRRLLAGIPQHGLTLGNPNAPVTIVEFIDIQCPFCAAHQIDEQPAVVDAVVRNGQAKITVQPLAFLGPDSGAGRNVLLRLANKNKAWDFLSLAFWNQKAENSGYITDAWLRKITAPIGGLTAGDLSRRREAALVPAIERADALSTALMGKGDGTPFFVVGRSSAAPATYQSVDLGAKSRASASIIAAVHAIR